MIKKKFEIQLILTDGQNKESENVEEEYEILKLSPKITWFKIRWTPSK